MSMPSRRWYDSTPTTATYTAVEIVLAALVLLTVFAAGLAVGLLI